MLGCQASLKRLPSEHILKDCAENLYALRRALRQEFLAASKRKAGLAVFVNVGQERYDSGSLDGASEIVLLLGGEAGNAARQNFAALGYKLAQHVYVFIVDFFVRLNGRNSTTEISHNPCSLMGVKGYLFNFFVHGVLVAVGAKLFQL